MSYFILEDFRLGQDTRKDPLTAAPGTLTTLINAHITRGGDLEKRKAFVSTYELPTGTFGLFAAAGSLYTFGSAAEPAGMPAGVEYQRLEHPSASAMTRLENAEIFAGAIYAVATYADGSTYHFYNGTRVTAFADGRARASFEVTGGTASAGVNEIQSIIVNGVEVLDTDVDWTTNHSATAAAIAAQINSYTSTPEYTATSDGAFVYIIAASGTGTTPNGYAVTVTVAGNVTVSTPTQFAGGSDTASFTPGIPVRTLGSKLYTTSGSLLVFSAVNDATDFTTGIGADNINMSSHSSGSETLTALEIFYDKLAIFAKEAVQLWAMSADPEDNAQAQVLRNTGTVSTRSVSPFGDGDIFYLASNGVRALKTGTINVLAQVSEVGTAIDSDVIDYLATLTDEEIENAVAIVEPIDKRYWLAVGERIYVYSFFSGSKIAAWSTYELGFSVTDFAVLNKRVYARSGDVIYLYGGAANATYDDCEVQFLVPYIDAQSPANPKTLTAVDMVARGSWFVQMNQNPDEPTAYDDIGRFTNSTLHKATMPAAGYSPYFAFLFTHSAEEYARFSRFIAHFEKDAAKAA